MQILVAGIFPLKGYLRRQCTCYVSVMLNTYIVIILSLDIEEIYGMAIQVSHCFLIIFKNALSGSGVFPVYGLEI